jgi:hypothetical protein
MITALCPLLFLLLALAGASQAHAHATSTTYLNIDATAERAAAPRLRWDISLHDLLWTLDLDVDRDGSITWGEIDSRRAAIGELAMRNLRMTRGASPCELVVTDLLLARHAGEPHVSLDLRARCKAAGPLQITGSLFFAEDASQRTLMDLTTPAGRFAAMLSATEPSWREPLVPSWTATLATFIGEGIWHVWAGYDHVAFLLLLLLPSVLRGTRREWQATAGARDVARDLLTIVTAFTLAHSLTLALAATGTVRLASGPVEIAIAASIVVAGALNLLPRLARWRLPLAFGFGLVHGFGFANALAELVPHGARLVPILTGFNLGVELGQLTVVAIILPLLLRARRSPFYATRFMPTASLATAIVGAGWLAARLP